MPHQLPPVDDDVFEALQRLAEPLVDDVNSVLRRLLGLKSAPSGARRPGVTGVPVPKSNSATPRRVGLPDVEFEAPLLEALNALGGRAPAVEAIDRVGDILGARLAGEDREVLRSGEIRWRNRVQFARLRLVRSGHLLKNSPRGTWELSEFGKQTARASKLEGEESDRA